MVLRAGYFCAAVFFGISLSSQGVAEPILLKSGARGDVVASVYGASGHLEGFDVGNLLELKVMLAPDAKPIPETDAGSVCQLLGLRTFDAIQSSPDLREALEGWFDIGAPLALVVVRFYSQEADWAWSKGTHYFDMRGIVTCRPVG